MLTIHYNVNLPRQQIPVRLPTDRGLVAGALDLHPGRHLPRVLPAGPPGGRHHRQSQDLHQDGEGKLNRVNKLTIL